jgi:CheY-like chemotaxis protein
MYGMPHKLLLADDSVTIQRVIELTFADEDVQVIAVGNGQAAIESVQRDRPDIVLADVGMPERNGYEVAAFIKGEPSLAHIPVVLLTGAFEPVDEGRARAVGCDGVLVKPFEPQIVISRVKDLLAGRQPSGMWSAGPVAQGPVRQAPAAFNSRPPAAGSAADPLEAYFDHLDAAFNAGPAAGGEPAPAPSAPPRRESIPVSRLEGLAPPAPAKGASNDPFADWDPDLVGDPARPAPVAAPPARPAPPPLVQQPAAPNLAPVPPPVAAVAPPAVAAVAPPPAPAPVAPAPVPARFVPPSLVDAFAALLAAEQRIGLAPSAATTPTSVPAPAVAAAAPAVTDELIETVTARVVARLTDQSRHTILDAAERLVREEIERIKQNS